MGDDGFPAAFFAVYILLLQMWIYFTEAQVIQQLSVSLVLPSRVDKQTV